MKKTLLFCCLIALFSSCGMLKYQDFSQHRYLDGNQLQKRVAYSNIVSDIKEPEKADLNKVYTSPNDIEELEPIAMVDENCIQISNPTIPKLTSHTDSLKTKEYGCDMITLSNGNVQSIKVTHVDHDEIKYKRCENGIVKGITFTIKKTDNFILQYAGGEKKSYPLINPNDYYGTNAADEEVANKKVMVAGIILSIALTLLLFISFGII